MEIIFPGFENRKQEWIFYPRVEERETANTRVKKREYKVPSIFQSFTVCPQIAPNSLFSPHPNRLSRIIFIFFRLCRSKGLWRQ